MKFTRKQFDEIGPWHFNDLCFDSTNQTTMLKIFNLLPSHLQGQAVSWGCDDSVFRDDVFEYLCENQFDMTVEKYYESDKFHWYIKKDYHQKISFKKLKPKVIQIDVETEGGPYTYVDDVLVTQYAAINLTGVQEAFINSMKESGNGYAKGELGIIVPVGIGKSMDFVERTKQKAKELGYNIKERDIMDKLNLDGVHMDMGDLLEKYEHKMHSCSDASEIQQISLFCQQNRNDYRVPVLLDLIKPMFAFAGLYPHIQKIHNIKPDKNA
jgi:hypothetical protein